MLSPSSVVISSAVFFLYTLSSSNYIVKRCSSIQCFDIGNREISSHKEVTTSIGSIMTELRYEFQSYDHGQTITCLARQTDGSWVSSYSQLNVVQRKINNPIVYFKEFH